MVTILINGAFCEDCDPDRSPQKYSGDHFVRASQSSEIRHFYEECDHSRSPLYCDHFMRTAIIVADLRNRAFLKRSAFF